MGMLDGRPFIPRTGTPVSFRHRRYLLKWTPQYGRTLISDGPVSPIRGSPVYRLEPKTDCRHNDPGSPCQYHFNVISLQTGRLIPYATIECYMVQLIDGEPLPKRPWWHEPGATFRREAPWYVEGPESDDRDRDGQTSNA